METKLNLLPPSRKAEIEKDKKFKIFFRMGIGATLVLAVFFSMMVSFKYVLRMNFSTYENIVKKENKTEYEKMKKYDEEFGSINSKVASIISLKREHLYWSHLFEKLNALVFSGIEVIHISTSDYLITVEGKALNRDDVILFKEKLEKEGCFSGINLPISDLTSKENVTFQIDFFINEDCLKNK